MSRAMTSAPATGSGCEQPTTSALEVIASTMATRNQTKSRVLSDRRLFMSRRLYERVADASNGPDRARRGAELLPEMADVHVERAVDRRVVVLTLHRRRELLARHRIARAPREREEHAKLERRELPLLPVHPHPAPAPPAVAPP